MELEEIFDELEILFLEAEAMKGLLFVLKDSLETGETGDNKSRFLAAQHIYRMMEEFNDELRLNLKALCAAVKFK